MTKARAIKKRALLILPAVLCFAGVSPVLSALADVAAPDHAHEIGMKVKCMCGGCNDSAGGCYHTGGAFSGPCDTALGMLKTIEQRLARGDSDDLIVQSFVQEYGAAVLIEPPHSGFAGLAWWIPALAFVAGLGLVVFVISRWRKRIGDEPALAAAGAGPPIPGDVLERARAQAARDTED